MDNCAGTVMTSVPTVVDLRTAERGLIIFYACTKKPFTRNGPVRNYMEGLLNSSRIFESAQLRLDGLNQFSPSSFQRVLQSIQLRQVVVP